MKMKPATSRAFYSSLFNSASICIDYRLITIILLSALSMDIRSPCILFRFFNKLIEFFGRLKLVGWMKVRMGMLMVVMLLFCHQGVSFCSALNAEGLALLRFREKVEMDPFGAMSNWEEKDGVFDPCEWNGVECADGKVVVLQFKDLCLKGTLAPDLGRLVHLKSIILRNNSFTGNIPKEIGGLKELEVLDLGYNNFSGAFPSEFSNNLSLTTLLLDNNKFLGSISPELYELKVLSEVQADENQLRASCNSRDMNWNMAQLRGVAHGMLLQEAETLPSESSLSPSSFSPSLSPEESSNLPSPPSPSPAPSPAPAPAPAGVHFTPPQGQPPTGFAFFPTLKADSNSKLKHHVFIIGGIVAGCLFVFIAAVGVLFFRSSKVVTVRPWATGLSGQLQRAFVAGVPNLKRVELDAACEDFSNIIGTFSDGTAYKGTLSSGVEIAVTSPTIKSHEGWTKDLESQFRKKIDSLSKVNHKNFVNLIGYCEENQPFTRMMVFEYAPNGTLFEHLHVKESEHLDWGMRLRIAMGMAYCLEHLHQLTPPIAHKNLQSSSIYLTEDYAAKISDFTFWNDVTAAKKEPAIVELLESSSAEPESDIYSLGVILFEMVTGRIPYTVGNGSVVDWASDYLRGEQPFKEMVDPTLTSFREDELEKLLDVIRSCVHPDPEHRPTIQEIVVKLKEITGMGPEGAMPKLSPLWWAELEILSTDGC